VDFPTGGTTVSSVFVPGPPVGKGDILHFGFQDNGNPPGQNPRLTPPTTDMLAGPPATPEGDQISDCNNMEWPPTFHLGTNDPADPSPKQYGNISVHL
jgi:hypothetical protein